LFGNSGPADSGGLLGRILGQHTNTVQSGVAAHSGLDSDQTRRLLMILAPMVLAMLAKRRQTSPSPKPIDTDLRQEAQNAQAKAPHVGGILGKILSYVETPRQ
jgi:hypothetical protein